MIKSKIILEAKNQLKRLDSLPFEEREREEARVARAMRSAVASQQDPAEERGRSWPELDPAALHGLAGEFVHALDPHTEADRVAVLVQFHAAFGSLIGRGPHFRAEDDRHYSNINAVLVGRTSKGRKGSSWGRVRRIFAEVDDEWEREHVTEGLSSGEGLIWSVRDSILKLERDRKEGTTREAVVDPGIEDKRLLIVESEFAGVLRVLSRDGNTLSPIMRRAWDRGDLRSLTKNSPARATGAHISIVGHIVADELRRYLTQTEAGNGFGNRYLWICVERSKLLPEGGSFDQVVDIGPFVRRLREAVGAARKMGRAELKRDDAARAMWNAIYPELSEGRPGMVGAMTARAEAQTMRLALLYALLDSSKEIREEHLLAALALWKYAEDSVRYIFGESLGDPVADTIFSALREAPEGLTRTQIRDLRGRHSNKHDTDRALDTLLSMKRVVVERTGTGGRPVEVWKAAK